MDYFEPLSGKLLDFRYFLYLVWKQLNLPDPTPTQYDIAHYIQHGPKRKVTEAFRGVGKSWVTSAYVCHQLRINPNKRFLIASASKDRADNFSTFTLRLIHEMPLLQCLIPRDDQRNAKISFDVGPSQPDHAPSVKSVGIFGQLAGSRADEIIADDIEIPNNSLTQLMRDKLSEAVKEFDAIIKPGGRITFLGTPQTEQSIYNELANRGYSVRIWPARYPKPEEVIKKYGDKLAPMIQEALDEDPSIAGNPTDPKRFSTIDLMEREASYGRSGFALQFMLDTSMSDENRYPLKLQDLVIMSIADAAPEKVVWSANPEYRINDLPTCGLNGDYYYRAAATLGDWLEFEGSVLAIDPSGRGADETGYAVVKMLNGYLYVTKCGGLQGGYGEEVLLKLTQIAKEQKVNRVLVESNFGDGMFSQLLKPYLGKYYPVTLEEVRSTQRKELRIIETLEPVMNSHRLIVDRQVIKDDYSSVSQYPAEKAQKMMLAYQLTRITKDRGSLVHDDRLDALELGVKYWTNQMAQDEDQKMQDRREDMLKLMLATFQGEAGARFDQLALGMTQEQIMRSSSMGGGIHRWI